MTACALAIVYLATGAVSPAEWNHGWELLSTTTVREPSKPVRLFVGSRRGGWDRLALVLENGEIQLDGIRIHRAAILLGDFRAFPLAATLGHGNPVAIVDDLANLWIEEIELDVGAASGDPVVQVWAVPSRTPPQVTVNPPSRLTDQIVDLEGRGRIKLAVPAAYRRFQRFAISAPDLHVTRIEVRLASGKKLFVPVEREHQQDFAIEAADAIESVVLDYFSDERRYEITIYGW